MRTLTIIGVTSLLVLAGCNSATTTQSTTENADSNTNAAVTSIPEGCPTDNTLTVSSEQAGTVEISSDHSYFLKWNEANANLVFANYALNPDSIYGHAYAETDVLTVIKLGAVGENGFTTGTYTQEPGAQLQASEFNISTIRLAGSVDSNNATVELTHVGDEYVCGSVNAQDNNDSAITGEFIAQHHVQS